MQHDGLASTNNHSGPRARCILQWSRATSLLCLTLPQADPAEFAPMTELARHGQFLNRALLAVLLKTSLLLVYFKPGTFLVGSTMAKSTFLSILRVYKPP